MNVRLNLLRWPDDLQAALRKDCWVILIAESKDDLDATHPEVEDEDTARNQLSPLGFVDLRVTSH